MAGGLLVAFLGAYVPPGWTQTTETVQREGGGLLLRSGEPAPADGVFFTGEGLTRLINALRDRESWQAQIETFKAQVAALEAALANTHEESQAKQQALEAMKLAVAKAEWIDSNWVRITERYEATLARMEAHADRLDKRIDSLEKQRLWLTILGPLGLLLGVFFR